VLAALGLATIGVVNVLSGVTPSGSVAETIGATPPAAKIKVVPARRPDRPAEMLARDLGLRIPGRRIEPVMDRSVNAGPTRS